MSGNIRARGGAKEMTISAVITRADGRVENLGVIAFHHRNPFKRLAFRAHQIIKRITGAISWPL